MLLHRSSCRTLVFLLVALPACGRDRDPVVELDLRQSIRDLGSEDLDVSSPAEDRLAAIGAPALPALAAALRQEPEAVRVGVIEVLAEMDAEGVSRLLIAALRDPAPEVRADAAFALRAHHGTPVERALVDALEDPTPDVRRNAALACGSSCGSALGVGALVEHALSDDAPAAAQAAATTLGNLHQAGDAALRRSIAAAIGSAAPARLAGPDGTQATRAAILLASVGDASGAGRLEAAVAEPGEPRLRLRATYALGQVGGPAAVPVLRELLAEPTVAPYAYDALRRAGERGVPGATAALDGYAGPRPPVALPPPAW